MICKGNDRERYNGRYKGGTDRGRDRVRERGRGSLVVNTLWGHGFLVVNTSGIGTQ
jgi:hypothetical protein